MVLGAREMWNAKGGDEPAYWGLCFTAEQAASTVAMTAIGTPPSLSLEYSRDASSWDTFTPGTTEITLSNIGDKVYFKAGDDGNVSTGENQTNAWEFTMTGAIAASGDISSLLDSGGTILDLTSHPYAFVRLFRDCSSLVAAPTLPATTLGTCCYHTMFYSTGIAGAPELPAMNLATSCYYSMFRSCSRLTTAPLLSATTLVSSCYNSMFQYCGSLAEIEVGFSSFGNTSSWVRNVSETGTFRCPTALGTNDTIRRGVSFCPAGWTVINTD